MDENIVIRQMVESDIEQVLAWRNHLEIRRYMLTQHKISLGEHRQWYNKNSQDYTQKLLIVEEGTISLGFVHFKGVAQGGIADWGFYAVPDTPKGSGRKLGTTALKYAFQALELHKVCGQALIFNEASIRFHSKLGFRQEGLLRQQCRINGTYYFYFGKLNCCNKSDYK